MKRRLRHVAKFRGASDGVLEGLGDVAASQLLSSFYCTGTAQQRPLLGCSRDLHLLLSSTPLLTLLSCDARLHSTGVDASCQAGRAQPDANSQACWAQPEARWHLVQGRSQTEGVPPISTVVAQQHVLMSSIPQLMSLSCDVLVRSADVDAGRQAGRAQPDADGRLLQRCRQPGLCSSQTDLCGSPSLSLLLVKAGLCGSQSMSLW